MPLFFLPLLAALFLPQLAFAEPASNAPRVFTIAIVRDGRSAESDAQAERLRQEITSLAGTRYAPVFPQNLDLDSRWDPKTVAQNLDRAQNDTSTDAVLVLGELSLSAAAAPEQRLLKPTFGALLSHSELIPVESPSANTRLSPILIKQAPDDIAALFRRLLPAASKQPWLVLTDYPDSAASQRWCARLSAVLGTPVSAVAFAASPEATIAGLPGDAKQFLCMPSLRLERAGRAALFRTLSARKCVVFSFSGQRDVEDGALAANLPDTDLTLARSLAIRLDQVATGQVSALLGSPVSVQPRFFLNETVAGAIGLQVNFDALHTASIVARSAPTDFGAPLTITQAALRALEANFTLKIKAEGTTQAKESQRMAAGALGPRVAATYRHQQVDRDRAEFAGVVLPETNIRAGLVLEQALIDDEAFSRHKAAREAYRAAGEQEKSARLEVVERALLAYIDALSAQALFNISLENLSRTEQHLALARLRQHAGTAGPEETLRFESAAAQQRGDMAAAKARSARALVALNRACNYPTDTLWHLEDTGLDSPAFVYSARSIATRLRNQEETERFLSWCTSYALTHSPDLGTLERQLAAQRIIVAQQGRRSYVPRVALSAQLDRVVDMELGGPTLIEQLVRKGLLPMPAHLPDRTEWAFAITAQVPLFTSGALSAEQRRSRSALRQLEFAQADARDAIAARARAAFLAITGSYPNIELSAIAHTHAARNLEITREKYERGTVSIIALLDAQTTAHDAREGAALAQYRFLSDLVSFHRALGWHELLSTKEEKENLTREIDQALSTNSQGTTQK